MLFVGLLALSSSGWAGENDPYVKFYGSIPGTANWENWQPLNTSNNTASVTLSGLTGTVKFRVYDENWNRSSCPNQASDKFLDVKVNGENEKSGQCGNNTSNGDNYYYTFNANPGWTYVVTYYRTAYSNNGEVSVKATCPAIEAWPTDSSKPTVQIVGDITGGWSTYKNMNLTGGNDSNQQYYEFEGTGSPCYFRIKINNIEYGPETGNNDSEIKLTGTGDPQTAKIVPYNNQKAFYFNTESGSTYTLKFWYEWGNKIRWELQKTNSSTQPDPGETGTFYALKQDGDEGWLDLTWSPSHQAYIGKITNWNNGYHFKVCKSTTYHGWNGANYYGWSNEDGNHWGVKSSASSVGVYADQQNYLNWQWGSYGTVYVYLYVKDGEGSEPDYLKFWEPNLSFATDVDKKGKSYLIGDIINNNTPSPAWEFTGSGTKNLGGFALRYNHNIGVVTYDNSGNATYKDFTFDVEMPHNKIGGMKRSDEFFSQAGWTYTATWDGTNLVLNPSAFDVDNKILPYIGILGQKFVQSKEYTTPIDFTTKDGNHTMGNTGLGWQEAYIEYGASGSPLTYTSNGKEYAYYNTVWPPRNTILLQANLDGTEPLKVSSNELTMKPESTRKTGTKWQTDLNAEFKGDYDELKLDAKRTYVRYVANNIWMQGLFKIWTGWGGNKQDWGANWDPFVFFGPTKENAAEDGRLIVKSNQTYDTSNDNAENDANLDFNAPARSFYRTMEIFIPLDDDGEDPYHGLDFNNAKFYLTSAFGQAQIDAISKDAKVGYMPSIVSWPEGYSIKSYTITRYAYEANVSSENYATGLAPCTRDRDEADYGTPSATVKTQTFTSSDQYLNEEQFAALFANVWSENNNYVLEGTYAPGRYIFRLEVEFVNDAESDKTRSVDVWSPYVEIIDSDYTADLSVYQLIELPKDSNLGYKYITYSAEGDYRGVTPNDNGTVSVKTLTVDAGTVTDIYENTGVWTNKVLFASRIPNNFQLQNADSKTVDYIKVFEDNAEVMNLVKSTVETSNSYYGVKDLSTALETKEYKAQFKGSVKIGENTQSEITTELEKTDPTVYTPSFMLPAFGKATLSLDEKSTENHARMQTASHGDINFEGDGDDVHQQSGVETYRHGIQADIEVLMPNVETSIRREVFGALSFTLNKSSNRDAIDGGTAQPRVFNIKGSAPTDENGDIDESEEALQYGIHYKYQSPYDWIKKTNDDITDPVWETYTHTWTIEKGSARYADGINGVSRVNPIMTVELSANPDFYNPEAGDNRDGESYEFENGSTMQEKIFNGATYGYSYNRDNGNGQCQMDIFLRNLELGALQGDDSFLVKRNENEKNMRMLQAEKLAYLIKVETPEEDFKSVSKVLSSSEAANDNSFQPVASFTFASLGNDWDNYQKVIDMFSRIKVYVSYAYYFSAGGEAGYEGSDADQTNSAEISSSGFIGLTSEQGFPSLRYDHNDSDWSDNGTSQANAPRKAQAFDDETTATKQLSTGDTAFLLAPVYTAILAEADFAEAMPTGIVSIGNDSDASIIVGEGYIDLNGNEGVIYSTDGRVIYSGNGRAQMTQGIYVVSFGSHGVKVLVK